ncbi:hypothetical protein CAEBREN_09758 [Caenorhabditis brenneri]|uniref:SPK domain-containing protein n=1 Tax=Caenorhabditis brenneri TaxID=135651 RepID=G0MAX9_CAEBE|nr:hypothetical protein CAEBREN_09758 [Caenorhabditis brenneri]
MAQIVENDERDRGTPAERDDYVSLININKAGIRINALNYPCWHHGVPQDVVSGTIRAADLSWHDKIKKLCDFSAPILSDLLLAKIKEHGELKLDELERIKLFTPKNGDRNIKPERHGKKMIARNVHKYYRKMEQSQTKAMEAVLAAEGEKDNAGLQCDDNGELDGGAIGGLDGGAIGELESDHNGEDDMGTGDEADGDSGDEMEHESAGDETDEDTYSGKESSESEDIDDDDDDDDELYANFALNSSEPNMKFKKVISIHGKALKLFPPMGLFFLRANRVNVKEFVNTDVLCLHLDHLLRKVIFGKAAPIKILKVIVVDGEQEDEEMNETTASSLWSALIQPPRRQYYTPSSPTYM